MRVSFSPSLLTDLALEIDLQLRQSGTINVSQTAERIRRHYESENIALEDIAEKILQIAQSKNAAMEFDSFGMRH